MEDNNPFKKIEPTQEIPRAELKKLVMKRISFKEMLGDLLGLFTVKLVRSAKDILDTHKPGTEEESSGAKKA